MLTLERVKEEAMSLTESERAKLAMDLLDSLPPEMVDDDELREVERRDVEMDADPSMGITFEELARFLGR